MVQALASMLRTSSSTSPGIKLHFSISADSRAIAWPIKFVWLHCFVAGPRSVTLTHNNTSTGCMIACRHWSKTLLLFLFFSPRTVVAARVCICGSERIQRQFPALWFSLHKPKEELLSHPKHRNVSYLQINSNTPSQQAHPSFSFWPITDLQTKSEPRRQPFQNFSRFFLLLPMGLIDCWGWSKWTCL